MSTDWLLVPPIATPLKKIQESPLSIRWPISIVSQHDTLRRPLKWFYILSNVFAIGQMFNVGYVSLQVNVMKSPNYTVYSLMLLMLYSL